MHMSDSIAVMDQGRIEQFGTAHQLYRQPRSRFVADFIGKSNILPGRLEDGPAFVAGDIRLPLAAAQTEGVAPGKADLFIRPEDIRIGPDGAVTGDMRLAAQVAASTYSGDRALYTLTLADGRLMRAYGGARDGALADGTPVTLAFDAADCILLA